MRFAHTGETPRGSLTERGNGARDIGRSVTRGGNVGRHLLVDARPRPSSLPPARDWSSAARRDAARVIRPSHPSDPSPTCSASSTRIDACPDDGDDSISRRGRATVRAETNTRDFRDFSRRYMRRVAGSRTLDAPEENEDAIAGFERSLNIYGILSRSLLDLHWRVPPSGRDSNTPREIMNPIIPWCLISQLSCSLSRLQRHLARLRFSISSFSLNSFDVTWICHLLRPTIKLETWLRLNTQPPQCRIYAGLATRRIRWQIICFNLTREIRVEVSEWFAD